VNHRVLTALVDGVAIEPGSPDARIAHWISELGADPLALLHVLNSLVPTSEDALRQIAIPTLVAIGEKDERSDADELAALLRDARLVRVPGDHGSAFAAPRAHRRGRRVPHRTLTRARLIPRAPAVR
jgi:pimeloyl-ACP methyl ester carboxylesterase